MKKKKENSKARSIAVYSGIGMSMAFEMAAAVGVGWWLGSLADKHWGIAPWGMIAGIVIFLFATLFHIVRLLIKLQSQDEDEGSVASPGGDLSS